MEIRLSLRTVPFCRGGYLLICLYGGTFAEQQEDDHAYANSSFLILYKI